MSINPEIAGRIQGGRFVPGVSGNPRPEQRQAQADRDACDRLLKVIFDRGLGQRQIARVTGIPLSTVQRALQRVFVDASLQVKKQGWFSTSEAYMRIGLKAQNQCRMTLETLAQIKNPPVVFARQANIAQGPQQVNNQMMPTSEPRARGENENTPNKLSGGSNELLPDPRTPGAAVGSDPAMATLGTFDRAKVRRG